jgi:hypothetical protein
MHFSRCEKLVAETGHSFGTQRKGNVRGWKPLPSNGYEVQSMISLSILRQFVLLVDLKFFQKPNLIIRIRWRWVVSFRPRSHYNWGKSPQYSFDWRLGRPQRRLLSELETQFLGCPSRSVIGITTELFRLHLSVIGYVRKTSLFRVFVQKQLKKVRMVFGAYASSYFWLVMRFLQWI